jgi:hypothetical protein
MMKRFSQLEAAAAHVGLVFAEQSDGRVGGDRRAGLIDLLLADQNPAGKDERASPFAAGSKPPLDEQNVHARFSAD